MNNTTSFTDVLGPLLPEIPLHQEETVLWGDVLNFTLFLDLMVIIVCLIIALCIWFVVKYCKGCYHPELDFNPTYHRSSIA